MKLYYETRNLPTNPPATLAADIARYIQMRQYLGTAVIVCDNPIAILSAVRKQWFKAIRYLQRLRASTLNAEEILRLTHALMHMNNMQFTTKTYTDYPNASAYFATPDQLKVLPPGCHTLYLTIPLQPEHYTPVFTQMQPESLVIGYDPSINPDILGLQPKSMLEQKLLRIWDGIVTYLRTQHIEPEHLVTENVLQFDAMDSALDTLLTVSDAFLREAAHLQRAINLSQPLTTIPREQQKRFEAVTRLAHRVQALTPGNFNDYLSISFGDPGSDMFFLRDAGSILYTDMETMAALLATTEL